MEKKLTLTQCIRRKIAASLYFGSTHFSSQSDATDTTAVHRLGLNLLATALRSACCIPPRRILRQASLKTN